MVTDTKPKREAILIALHADGYIETFASKSVDIKFVDIPHCPGRESLAEDYVEQSLPHVYRKLFYPGYVRGHAMHRPLTPSTIAEADAVTSFVKGLNGLSLNQNAGAA